LLRRVFVFLGLLIAGAEISIVDAQVLYSVGSVPGFPLVTIDPNTGTIQTVQPTGSFTGVTSTSTFDPSGRRLFFVVDSAGVPTLVVVNVQTRTVTTHPILLAGGSAVFLEFDSSTGILYSVSSAPGFPLLTIDPSTGAIQTVQPTGSFTGVTGTSAFDPSGRRLFFVADEAGVPTLVVVNVQTGAVALHPISLAGGSAVFLEFDPNTGLLYSVSSAPGFPLLTIDPSTGAVQTVQSTGSFTGVTGTSAFDPSGRRLFFVADNAGVPTLVVVNVQTGVVALHPISLAGGSFVFLEFDPFGLLPTNIPATSAVGTLLTLVAIGAAGFVLARQLR
jgi:Tol biopolymer transport system component